MFLTCCDHFVNTSIFFFTEKSITCEEKYFSSHVRKIFHTLLLKSHLEKDSAPIQAVWNVWSKIPILNAIYPSWPLSVKGTKSREGESSAGPFANQISSDSSPKLSWRGMCCQSWPVQLATSWKNSSWIFPPKCKHWGHFLKNE